MEWLLHSLAQIEFTWWWMCVVFPIPFVLRLIYAKSLRTQQQQPIFMPTYRSISSEAGLQSQRSPWLRYVLFTLTWLCLVIAVMRPTFYGEAVTLPKEGRDLFIAVDLSGSMQTQDMMVNGREADRLVMVKHVLSNFIEERVGDRLGLILFADTAYLQAPLTFDRATVQQLLDETVLGLVGESTAIGDAIGLATKRLEDKSVSKKVLILLTDGQNTAGNITPDQALELAVTQGLTIYPIGVGAERMAVNSLFGQRQVNPSADLDEALLTRLAKETGGQYFRARDTEELETIYALLNQIEPIADDSETIRPQKSVFYLALIAAVALALIWWLLSIGQRQFKWRLAL